MERTDSITNLNAYTTPRSKIKQPQHEQVVEASDMETATICSQQLLNANKLREKYSNEGKWKNRELIKSLDKQIAYYKQKLQIYSTRMTEKEKRGSMTPVPNTSASSYSSERVSLDQASLESV